MAGKNIIEISDNNFDEEVLKSSGGLLGPVVWSLPSHRSRG